MLVVSAATDAKFKLWEGVPATEPPAAVSAGATTADEPPSEAMEITVPSGGGGAEALRWACRSVGYYRQTAATAVAFSADGSLLAVAYAPDVVTLWDPLTNEMLHALCQPLASPLDELSYVGFAGEGGALLAHSSCAVLCWSVLSGSLAWMHAATAVLSAATDPQSDAMLVAVALSDEPSTALHGLPLTFHLPPPSIRSPSPTTSPPEAPPPPPTPTPRWPTRTPRRHRRRCGTPCSSLARLSCSPPARRPPRVRPRRWTFHGPSMAFRGLPWPSVSFLGISIHLPSTIHDLP